VLIPPAGLPEAELMAVLAQGWGMSVASLQYQAVGWGSHHWAVTDAAGIRWFVTVDELENKRASAGEPLATAYLRLRAALAAARDLADCGAGFVVAPVPGTGGEPLARVAGRFGLAVYPFVAGQSFPWGEFSAEHRRAVAGLVAAVHNAPAAARRRALADDFTVPHRDELAAACDPARAVPGAGPYAGPAARLIRQHAAPLGALLARYDRLAARARARPPRMVLTHGEPHPGNTMLVAGGGWRLIDWDTALIAPPERDLWDLDPGDGTVLGGYAQATGFIPEQPLLDLYRLRWDITDIAADVSRFRRPHTGTAEDAEAWALLSALVNRVTG
jgi:aminoglycoside phosphotransferase (APT) family kinase protein